MSSKAVQNFLISDQTIQVWGQGFCGSTTQTMIHNILKRQSVFSCPIQAVYNENVIKIQTQMFKISCSHTDKPTWSQKLHGRFISTVLLQSLGLGFAKVVLFTSLYLQCKHCTLFRLLSCIVFSLTTLIQRHTHNYKEEYIITSELRCHMQKTGMFITIGLFLSKVNSIFNVYNTCRTDQAHAACYLQHKTRRKTQCERLL